MWVNIATRMGVLERRVPALYTTTCWSNRANLNKTNQENDVISLFLNYLTFQSFAFERT